MLRDWDASYSTLRSVRILLARAQEPLDELDEVAQRLGLRGSLGRLKQVPGNVPDIDWLSTPAETNATIFTRARAAELHALLGWGRGIWAPDDYHFRLPSGYHVSTFIKVGNAVRTPHDADVLASWLDEHLVDGMAVISDATTVSPIILAVKLRMQQAGWAIGPTEILEDYPRTQLDAAMAVAAVSRRNPRRILGVLSVNSSGLLLSRLLNALKGPEFLDVDWRIAVLVDTDSRVLDGKVERWLPMGGRGSPVAVGGESSVNCSLCRDEKRSMVVPIDPVSFNGVIPAEVDAVMPAYRALKNNRLFWELTAQCEAVEVEASPDAAVVDSRPSTLMPIKVRWGAMLSNMNVVNSLSKTVIAEAMKLELGPEPLVLVPAGEDLFDGYQRFQEIVMSGLGVTRPFYPFPRAEEWDDALVGQVAESQSILVLSLGMVTGSSLQRGLLGVQAHHPDPNYSVSGLVVHARPSSPTEWRDVNNIFEEGRLRRCWLTFLPQSWSPLADEARVLSSVEVARLSPEGRKFLQRRRQLCSGALDTFQEPLFWGSTVEARLTPHALPGENLDAVSTYAALGAALQEVRQAASTRRPIRKMIDLRRAFRSYFDDFILVSILRWTRGEEAYWGDDDAESESVITHVLGRSEPTSRAFLLAELLLGVALGKVPGSRLEELEAQAASLQDINPEAIELGLNVAAAATRRRE